MRRNRIEIGVACGLATLLILDLVVLLLLRPIVASEGIPKDGDVISGAAHAYASVVFTGILWVPVSTVAVAVLGARAMRDAAGWVTIAGHLWIIGCVLFLCVMAWAGALWLGFGW